MQIIAADAPEAVFEFPTLTFKVREIVSTAGTVWFSEERIKNMGGSAQRLRDTSPSYRHMR
jgi:hypothetical protein